MAPRLRRSVISGACPSGLAGSGRRFIGLAALLLTLPLLQACVVPGMTDLRSTPAPTPEPQVVVVVATPTPGPLPEFEPADAVEARRIALYKRVAPAVVNITTQVLRSDFFWGTVPEEGSGSGFVWDTVGHIVTNYHVIQGASEIAVSFGGDVTSQARVVGSDPVNDLAVLEVDVLPEGVQPLETGVSADLQVGQTAIAIGNPFGQFERTMTDGIISALNRTLETENTVLRGVIQTDAAINRGNSGGPLLDLRGRLIGVNTAIFSPTGTSAGVGLAIPVDKVRRVVPVLIERGRFPHPWLGIEELGYEISPALAQALDLPLDHGLLIARLYRNSPADKVGLRGAQRETILRNRRYLVGGDILTLVDGRAVSSWEDLSAYLDEQCEVGQRITLVLLRDGQELTLMATLEEMPESLQP
jgi:S1-C subfamily serine protease